LIYPAFILVATVGIVIMLMIYVFPKILPIFSSFKAELPWSTKLLIAVSSAAQAYWLWFLAVIILLLAIWGFLSRVESIRRASDRFTLNIPLLGPMFRCYFHRQFHPHIRFVIEKRTRHHPDVEYRGRHDGQRGV